MNEEDLLVLRKTLNFTANGEIPSDEDREIISKQLSHLQERLDLTEVAIGNFHMRRIADLTDKIMKVENQIFLEDGEMAKDIPMEVRIAAWKELGKQLQVSTEFIGSHATTPSVSSPERMERVAHSPEVSDDEVRHLPASSRAKIAELLRRIMTKANAEAQEAEVLG